MTYFQTWHWMPYRWPWLHYKLQALCKFLTGHQASATEWGWGGGDMVDCHCRWCDALIRISVDEANRKYLWFRRLRFKGIKPNASS